MFSPRSILVPTDFSPDADAALKSALDLASRFKSRIYLLHVIDAGLQECAVDYCLPYAAVERLKEESRRTSKVRLEKELKAIAAARDVEVVFDVQTGIPFETILKEQQEKGIDLIVIGSHGKTGVLKHLMGSVAEKVVRGAKCPVLVTREMEKKSGT